MFRSVVGTCSVRLPHVYSTARTLSTTPRAFLRVGNVSAEQASSSGLNKQRMSMDAPLNAPPPQKENTNARRSKVSEKIQERSKKKAAIRLVCCIFYH